MLRLSWLVGIVRSKVGCQFSTRAGRVGWAASVIVAGALLLPVGASAATCTDTWTGPAEGSWETAKDWSLGTVPTSSDVACIGPKTTVEVLGSNTVGVLQVEGTLLISGGSLEVSNTSEASAVTTLVITGGGILKGAATVDVSSSFSETNGEMSGSGSTVIQPGASASFGIENTRFNLAGRTLVNEGTATLEAGHITEEEGAVIDNSGTFIANAESVTSQFTRTTGAASIVNTGLFEKTSGAGSTKIAVNFENFGTLVAKSGSFRFAEGTTTWATASVLEGLIEVLGISTKVIGGDFLAQNATIELNDGTLEVTENSTVTIENLILRGGLLTGAGTVYVSNTFSSEGGELAGSGITVLKHGSKGTIGNELNVMGITARTLINEGVVTFMAGHIDMSEGAQIININTFKADSEVASTSRAIALIGNASIQNYGLFEKTVGTGITTIAPYFENHGAVVAFTGQLEFSNPVRQLTATQFAERSPSAPHQPRSNCGDPVNCATGNFYATQTDLSAGGRSVGLNLTRTYNSQAGVEGTTGIFGHGWSNSFGDHLVVEGETTTLYHGNGSAVPFTQNKAGALIAPAWTQDKLAGSSGSGYTLTLANQVKYQFEGSTGRLQSVTDRNLNQTKLGYNKAGQLETITDPAGRKITLTYNKEGLVESAKDPLGHTVKYTYEEGTLASVTLPGESKARWQYHYGEAHQMTSMIDGRAGTTSNEYNGAHQVSTQTDPAGHKLKFEYEAFHTKITNNGTGSVTSEWFNSDGEPTSITRGFETGSASTETLSYDISGNPTGRTDGNGHTTEYTYDANGNMTNRVDPNRNETQWTYNGTHDVLTVTNPKGETTTITRDGHGNAETVSRPAPGKSTQTVTYHYDTNGNLTSAKDPLGHVWSYEYKSQGDRTSEADPEGDKRTFTYDEDSRMISTVSPEGQVKGAEASKYTTKIERDAQGRPTTVTDPLGHTTKHVYDGNGNLETLTDANGHTTTYTYNGDNQVTVVKAPNGNTTETEYDGAGRVIGETDGNKHKTTYVRNILGEVVEVKDPLGRVTSREYDSAGNLNAAIDPAKRKTTFAYDSANRLKEISYSDGTTPTVKYEYDADGNRTKMTDGTGTTTYTYDVLDRLVHTTNGHNDSVGWEYDLLGDQTKLAYPGGNQVTRAYDTAGRLQSVADWAKNTTTFAYNADSAVVTTTFPKATGAQDKVAYNQADQVMKITMVNGTKAVASLAYARDNIGQVKTTTTAGLPGAAGTSYGYDMNNRLTSAGASAYEYDAANNPTKTGASTNTYDAASELETGTGVTYGYDQLGERTTSTPKGGQTTTYNYDQAGNLTQVKQGKLNGLNDLYTYDGNGLRAAQIKGKATNHLTWNVNRGLPLLLSDEQSTYVYGPGGLPIEVVQSKGAVLYLHHDQQGSTRLLTGSTGTTEASMTYDAYGNLTGSTGAVTTPLGYDGQYTNADTGLIYMRLRVYDPATAQFLTVDPIASITRARYYYSYDNPLYYMDPTGLGFFGDVAAVAGAASLIPGVDVVAGPVALVSGGIAAIQDTENGEYLNAAADASGVVLGTGSLLEKHAAEVTNDAAQALLKNPEYSKSPEVHELERLSESHEIRQITLELGGTVIGIFPPEGPNGAPLPIQEYLEVPC